jgi:para-aminobenzoate synthetase / 4-amino-4-deoxychorismate lyase
VKSPEGTVFLKTAKPSSAERRTLLFSEPREIWTGPPAAFSWDRLRSLSGGAFVAGYLSHDLAEAMAGLGRGSGPLPSFWFGAYDSALLRDEFAGTWSRWDASGKRIPCPAPRLPEPRPFRLRFRDFDVDRPSYLETVRAIREAIADGHYYQTNLTVRARFDWSGDPAGLLAALLHRQPVPYGAIIRMAGGTIVSASPELFLRARGNRVLSRPMKGTGPAGAGGARMLRASAKDRAENLMIADLVRNDLGRVAREVRVSGLFRVERYATLSQMVSSVEADLLPGADPWSAVESAFPAGSVTGAPKSSAMEAIAGLERSPRGVYTGVIGYGCPWGEACFSVAIRTAQISGRDLLYGTGGGITYASDPDAEWEECRTKVTALADLAR